MGLLKLLVLFITAACQFSEIASLEVRTTADVDAFGFPVRPLYNGSILVDTNNTELAYTDSGPPADPLYTTIFIINGMGFNGGIFSRIQALASASAFRIVAVNRRGYAGSTPFSDAEISIIMNGTSAQREAFYTDTGVELATFMDTFMQKNNIPPISADRKSGGAALIGWSMGNILSVAAIGHIDAVPADMQARLAARIHTLVMQEPSSNALGLPAPPQNWVPIIDTTIPSNVQYPAFAQWVTAYFDQGNLSARDPNALSYVLPATFRSPSIFNMTLAQYASIIDTTENPVIDFYQLFPSLAPQLLTSYRQANYNATIRALLPNMKNWLITGDVSAPFGPYALFVVQDDNEAAGGGYVNFKVINGVNHFIHWDNPETALEVYHELFEE